MALSPPPAPEVEIAFETETRTKGEDSSGRKWKIGARESSVVKSITWRGPSCISQHPHDRPIFPVPRDLIPSSVLCGTRHTCGAQTYPQAKHSFLLAYLIIVLSA